MRIGKKGNVLVMIVFWAVPVFSQSILEEAGRIMKLLGLDVPVYDLLLKDSEKDWLKEEKRTWDWWKSLYEEFRDLFDGRLRQMIERHTGFEPQGKGFDSLIENAENILALAEESLYYADYLDHTLLGRMRKRDRKKRIEKAGNGEEDKGEESQNTEREREAQEFRDQLLESQVQELHQRNFFYGQEQGRKNIDNDIARRSERLQMMEGFLNLLTQVELDEEKRGQDMEKRLSVLEDKAKNKTLVSQNAEGEELTDTAELLAVMVGITEDLAGVDEAIHKMILQYREIDFQAFLNQRQSFNLLEE